MSVQVEKVPRRIDAHAISKRKIHAQVGLPDFRGEHLALPLPAPDAVIVDQIEPPTADAETPWVFNTGNLQIERLTCIHFVFNLDVHNLRS